MILWNGGDDSVGRQTDRLRPICLMSSTLTDHYLLLLIGAGSLLALGVASGIVKNRLWISEPAVTLAIGIWLGPLGLDLISEQATDPGGATLREIARITLAIAVMGAALRIQPGFLVSHWRDLLVVLTLGMGGMAAVSALLSAAWFALPLMTAVLVGAVLAPTDPVIASAVVTGKVAESGIKARLRDMLSLESGANDGLALLLVALPLLLMDSGVDDPLGHWLRVTLLREVGIAVAVGLATGYLCGQGFIWVKAHPLSEHSSTITISFALALTAYAATRVLHADGILAVFIAGLVFGRFVGARRDTRQEPVQEAYTRFFELPVFMLIGAALPWAAWLELGYPLVLFTVLVLLLRRLPVWFCLRPLLATTRSTSDTAVAGWFGPVGIASVFYATYAVSEEGPVIVWPIVSAVVFASVILHGATATPIAGRAARLLERGADGGGGAEVDVPPGAGEPSRGDRRS